MKLSYEEWLKTEKGWPKEISYLHEITDKTLLDMYVEYRGFSLDTLKVYWRYYKRLFKNA